MKRAALSYSGASWRRSTLVEPVVKMRVDHPYSPKWGFHSGRESDARGCADMKIGYGQPNGLCFEQGIAAEQGKSIGIFPVELERARERHFATERRRDLARDVVTRAVDDLLKQQDVRPPESRFAARSRGEIPVHAGWRCSAKRFESARSAANTGKQQRAH